jgi:HAE1 family hydrophobic/amphiphilic exporter-1
MLEWSMAHRGIVAALAVAVLLSSVPMFRIVNINFTPQDDQSEFDVSLRAPEGTSLEATEMTANRVASAIRQIPEVVYTMITVAGDSAGTLNTASIYVRLKPIDERDRDQFVIMDTVRNEVLPKAAPQGVKASLTAPGIAGGGGGGQGGQGDVTFVLQGPDLRTLERASNTLADKARAIPGLVDVDTSLRVGKPEMSVRLDRPKAADLGVQMSDAADALRLLVGGDQVTTFNEAGEQYEVHLRAEEQDRGSQAAVARLTVPSSRLGAVPLENIASFAQGEAPADIRRLNRLRQVTSRCQHAARHVTVGRATADRR